MVWFSQIGILLKWWFSMDKNKDIAKGFAKGFAKDFN